MKAWRGILAAYGEWIPLPKGTPVVTLHEGGTPLLPLDLGADRGVRVWVKVDGMNPTGSFKDRGMTVAVSEAVGRGARVVICASTGNTAASAAAYAARAGVRAVVLLPQGQVALGKLSQAMVAGATVVSLAGNFDRALALVRELVEIRPDLALVNSVNPWRLEGQKTAAFEIVDELGDAPTHLAIPVGNAGNITAYWRGFTAYRAAGRATRLPKMLGFQAAGAAPLVRGEDVPQPQTVATAIRIGRPASAEGARQAVRESGGAFAAVTDEEILSAYRWLARQGIFCEPASAASVAGVRKLLEAGSLERGAQVVAVLTGHGLKDPQTAVSQTEPPLEVPGTLEAVREVLESL